MDLDKVGNEIAGYTARPRVVTPLRPLVIADGSAVLKSYTMFDMFSGGLPERTHDGAHYIPVLRHQIGARLRNGEVMKGLGLGFSIISEGMVNVALWGSDGWPSVMTQALYSFDVNNPRVLTREDVGLKGTFCAWEAEIAGHEGKAWQRFLHSQRTNADKRQYVNDTFKGATSDVYLMSPRDVSVKDLGFSRRALEGLASSGINDMQQLIDWFYFPVMEGLRREPPQVGKVTMEEYHQALKNFGLE